MNDGSFTTTVSVGGLGPDQRRRLDEELRAEGIPVTWLGDGLRIDQAFEPRVESLVARSRSASTVPPGPEGSRPGPPPPPLAPPPPPYSAPLGVVPAPRYLPMRVTNSNATLSLVLGVLGLAVCPIMSIFGVIYGRRAQDEIATSGGTQTGEGLAKAGIVLSWIVIICYGIVLVAFLLFFLLLSVIGIAASVS